MVPLWYLLHVDVNIDWVFHTIYKANDDCLTGGICHKTFSLGNIAYVKYFLKTNDTVKPLI